MTRIKTFISRNITAGLLILSFVGGFAVKKATSYTDEFFKKYQDGGGLRGRG